MTDHSNVLPTSRRQGQAFSAGKMPSARWVYGAAQLSTDFASVAPRDF